ncbi:MAG: L,D-transpeptidase YcbB [Sphingomonadales bacterium]|jgi:murein L,D-transpeptidase YcbB/YkuD|nr:L,D-transpeptidase YcbB [Sphingomonadales bacterium]
MRKLVVCVSLAALLAGGCDVVVGGGNGQAVQTDVKNVSAADLKAAVTDPRVKRFYEARGWAPVWNEALVKDLTGAFADAERHALQGAAYVREVKQGSTPAEREAALTLNALDYADALANGAVDPRKVFDPYTVERGKVDVATGLQQAVQGGKVREWLASLAPQDEEYRALSDAYMRYAGRAKGPKHEPIPPGKGIKPGGKDPRVPAIAAALKAEGFLQAPPTTASAEPQPKAKAAKPADPILYTKAMASAVARVQLDYGIAPDGVVGNSTLEALNNGAGERARILAVNLERRRWLNRQPAATRIDVNTAATILTYWRDGAVRDKRAVVAGQPDWETPELSAPMRALVANPDWTIPEKIAKEEIIPKGRAYMAAQQISEKNGRLVQASGEKSALGMVKFDLDDPYAIYLHDTPAKPMFANPERHQSHGCVRVADALGFARMLAEDEGVTDQFEKALATGKETTVSLPTKIPVRLMYHTAYLDGGRVVFRADPYGWDDRLALALGLGGALRHRVVQHVHEIGP